MYCNKLEELLTNNIEHVDWYSALKNPNISEEFFVPYLNEIDDEIILKVNKVKEYYKKLKLGIHTSVCRKCYLSNCSGKRDPYKCLVTENIIVDENFFDRHVDFINWYQFVKKKDISEEFLERNLHKLNSSVIWKCLCENLDISEEFLERHLDNLDWECISKRINISEEFLERNLNNLDWNNISRNKGISEKFFEIHLDKVIWGCLCQNDSISEAFFERYLDKIEWLYISNNNGGISIEFYMKYIEHTKEYMSKLCKRSPKWKFMRITREFKKELIEACYQENMPMGKLDRMELAKFTQSII